MLRTCLALSVALNKPVHIFNIRAKRPKPGLRPQHLTCVKAAQFISGAEVKGAFIGSKELFFTPGETKAGNYAFDIGTAGSTMLVLQTVLLPLALCQAPSHIRLTGGTHVPWSPHFHYIQKVFLPACTNAGIDFSMKLERWGWYPKGGGKVLVDIAPWKDRKSFSFDSKFAKNKLAIKAMSAISRLPTHVLRRQADQLKRSFKEKEMEVEVEEVIAKASCPGSLVFCWTAQEGCYAGFTGLGSKGKPAEKVADEAAAGMLSFLHSRANVDFRLADQLVTVAALCGRSSTWLTQKLTGHLETNCWVAEQFGTGKFTFFDEDGAVRVVYDCRMD